MFTASSDVLCITCEFIDGSSDASCHAVLTSDDGGSTFIFEIAQSGSLPTSSLCINVLSAGKYQLQIYDVDINGKVLPEPVFSFDDVLILESGET